MKRSKKKKEQFITKLTNLIAVVFLAAVILVGLKVYSASENNLTFAQISDDHYSSANTNTSYRLTAESGELLKDAIDQVNSTPDVDFVMFTGDMVNTPYEKEVMKFLTYANQLKYPWYAVLGNHDVCIGGNLTKKLYWQILNSHNPNFNFQKTYYSFVPKKGYKVIGLDTIIDTRITANGKLGEEQLKWLDKELAKSKHDVVLIFMHGPLVEPMHSANHKTLDADEALGILHKYKMPIAVFSGHYHTTKITEDGNVLHVSTPALVSYPNAFRMVKVSNQKDKAVFDIALKETTMKSVQMRAKIMVFGANTYIGKDEDRNGTFTINKK